jgi:hypothetical protein
VPAATGRASARRGTEIAAIREAVNRDPVSAMHQLDALMIEHRVGAAISYTFNGCELPGEFIDKTFRSYFELRGVPHMMYWLDHPQWAHDRIGLRADLQPAFRSPNCFHFVKSAAHAFELNRILGWPNCAECAPACDAAHIKPAYDVEPDFDVVAIFGGSPQPAAWMQRLLDERDPDPHDIAEHYTEEIRAEMSALWDVQNVQPQLLAQLRALGDRLMQYRLADLNKAAAWHLPALSDEFPQAMGWLTFNYPVYFRMVELTWRYRGWLREFMIAYLAKHFRVAVFGGDWSALGCQCPSSEWVDFVDMPRVFARGKVVLNLSAGHDEEGLTAKPFEIAASAGGALVHNDCVGIERYFEPGVEIETFSRPREAVEVIRALLSDDARRKSMTFAARRRVERDHCWDSRLIRLLANTGMDLQHFQPAQAA